MCTYDQRTGKGPINPFTDCGFKYFFGREENKDLLVGFLNLLLETDVRISELQYLNAEILGDRLFSDLLTIIPLQLPCIKAKNVAECRKSYEVLLFLLQSMSKRLKTKEELLAELDTLDLPEQMLATFRRVVNTVEEDLPESERRDYEVDLEKYIKTMGMIRTGREEGREEGLAEGLAKGRTVRSREIARAMKANGVDIDLIAKCTGLSSEEIQTLAV